ncbi:hypothetical protein B0H10DRAFT_2222172 [Mycena sp. CBHHK59/15]|nr:hypothetical protein B0H10DRAFT_2222172 [Mycena sp. CBHHK59/15]
MLCIINPLSCPNALPSRYSDAPLQRSYSRITPHLSIYDLIWLWFCVVVTEEESVAWGRVGVRIDVGIEGQDGAGRVSGFTSCVEVPGGQLLVWATSRARPGLGFAGPGLAGLGLEAGPWATLHGGRWAWAGKCRARIDEDRRTRRPDALPSRCCSPLARYAPAFSARTRIRGGATQYGATPVCVPVRAHAPWHPLAPDPATQLMRSARVTSHLGGDAIPRVVVWAGGAGGDSVEWAREWPVMSRAPQHRVRIVN